jgi:integrase
VFLGGDVRKFHAVRHSFATLALEAGVHPKVVSDILGHSSVAITLGVYSHSVKGLQEDATSMVASLVFGSGR